LQGIVNQRVSEKSEFEGLTLDQLKSITEQLKTRARKR
jgi:hypothetical protein